MATKYSIERSKTEPSKWLVSRLKTTRSGLGYWLVLISFDTKKRCREWLNDYKQQLNTSNG